MKSIEQLLKINRNKERYNLLKSELAANRLVIFFGAGLSLGGDVSRKWEKPFEKICEMLLSKLEYFEEFINDIGPPQMVNQEKIQIAEIRIILNNAHQMISNEEFLAAGDKLSEAFSKLQKMYQEFSISEDLEELEDYDFEDLIASVFKCDSYPEVYEDYTSPYKIKSTFYLPYIGNMLITTNIDLSFDEVIKRLKIHDWHSILTLNGIPVRMDWTQETKRIFYIHGHISEPQSLVMTGSQYEKVYPRYIPEDGRVYGARELLKKTVQEKSVMFLGASLNRDRTVELINLEAKNSADIRRSAKLHFIPVVSADNAGKINNPPEITNSRHFLYSKGMYEEISFLLLQLIRDTDNNWSGCKWREPNLACEYKDIPDELKNELDQFLSSDDDSIYNELDITGICTANPSGVICYSDVIYYLYKHYSLLNQDSGLGWNICHSIENKFSLDGSSDKKSFSPLHNYPLGDTIYCFYSGPENMFGEFPLYEESAQESIKEIEDWRRKNTPYYLGKSGEEASDWFSPRIRVIVMQLNSAPNSRYKNKREVEHEVHTSTDKLDSAIAITLKSRITMDQKQELYKSLRETLVETLKTLLGAILFEISQEQVSDYIKQDPSHDNTKSLQRILGKEGE